MVTPNRRPGLGRSGHHRHASQSRPRRSISISRTIRRGTSTRTWSRRRRSDRHARSSVLADGTAAACASNATGSRRTGATGADRAVADAHRELRAHPRGRHCSSPSRSRSRWRSPGFRGMTLNYQERRIYHWHEELDRRIEAAGHRDSRAPARAAAAGTVLRELTRDARHGIQGFGAYLPRLRLERAAIVDAMGWAAGLRAGKAQGARSYCNWDEDALTMAVEAARDCLARPRPQRGRIARASHRRRIPSRTAATQVSSPKRSTSRSRCARPTARATNARASRRCSMRCATPRRWATDAGRRGGSARCQGRQRTGMRVRPRRRGGARRRRARPRGRIRRARRRCARTSSTIFAALKPNTTMPTKSAGCATRATWR